jgi:hypothetical protein
VIVSWVFGRFTQVLKKRVTQPTTRNPSTCETFGAPSLLKTMTGADDLSQPFPNCDANYKARTKDEKNGDGGSTAETRKMAKSKIQTQAGKRHKRFGTENARPRRSYAS